ncbi:MAG: hypothetical protein H7331_00825 [Bacteroidia bacterium]|nr:hypothetical protein [Bacteroidia bacterium]
MRTIVIIILAFLFMMSGCSVIRKTPKTSFADGYYIQKNKDKVYIDVEDEVVRVHKTVLVNNKLAVDTTKSIELYKQTSTNEKAKNITFSKRSFDVDFLTMPLKYRPKQNNIPAQLNTNLNGAIYAGFRTDKFDITYNKSELHKLERVINHYGFSFGVFTGLGNTAVNATTTNNLLITDYDGLVWIKGIAGIVAINTVTVGVSLGFDNLIDSNNNKWIYENKPWFGLAFGLNLN